MVYISIENGHNTSTKGEKSMSERRERSKGSERRTPEGRESYLVNLAMERAEEMLLKGTAPAQIIAHFLKLGTEKAKYEREKLKADTQLAVSKASLVESQRKSEEIAAKALEAFKKYAGVTSEDEEEEDDEY